MSVAPTTEDTAAADQQLERAVEREFDRQRRLRARDLVLSILTPLVLLAAWEIAARTGAIDARLFSPPSKILETAVEKAADGSLWRHAGATTARLLAGFILGAIAGIVTGLLMGVIRPLRAALGPMFTALYALPKIAILPLLLLIFGLTETPKILSVAITVFFVLQINTVAGIMQIDPRILEAARAYRAQRLRLFWHVLLPAATPTIFTGLRVAAGTSVIVITAVEFVASNDGLGFLIWNSWQLFQPPTMYVGLIAVALLGALMTLASILLERALMPWKYSSARQKRKTR